MGIQDVGLFPCVLPSPDAELCDFHIHSVPFHCRTIFRTLCVGIWLLSLAHVYHSKHMHAVANYWSHMAQLPLDLRLLLIPIFRIKHHIHYLGHCHLWCLLVVNYLYFYLWLVLDHWFLLRTLPPRYYSHRYWLSSLCWIHQSLTRHKKQAAGFN